MVLPARARRPCPGLLFFPQASTQRLFPGWPWPPATAAAGTALLPCCTAPGAGERSSTQSAEREQTPNTTHPTAPGTQTAHTQQHPPAPCCATGRALRATQPKNSISRVERGRSCTSRPAPGRAGAAGAAPGQGNTR